MYKPVHMISVIIALASSEHSGVCAYVQTRQRLGCSHSYTQSRDVDESLDQNADPTCAGYVGMAFIRGIYHLLITSLPCSA